MKTKYIKYIIVAICAILLCVTTILLCVNLFLPVNPSTKFEMIYDNDKNIYNSNGFAYSYPESLLNNYLTYNCGELQVKDFSKTEISIFEPDNSKSLSVPTDAYLFDKKIYYISDNNLCFKDYENNAEKVIDSSCSAFCIGEKNIIYKKENLIIVTDKDDFNNKTEITEIEGQLYYLNIENNTLYLIVRDGQSYKFSSYDVNTSNQINDYNVNLLNPIESICLSDNNLYFYYETTQSVHNVNMLNGELMKVLSHADVIDMAVNGNKLYYISEQSQWNVIRTTVDCEDNGVWEFDVSTGEKKQLSEECEFVDLLATGNFVYCYKVDYVLPRGMASSWVKGYEISQIPIKED